MSRHHPFRFGIASSGAGSADEWRDKVRRVEALGYATMLLPDTLGPGLSVLPALAAAAFATSTLRLGSWVLVGDRRNPLQLVRDAATVDLLSNGRLELGLGAGRPDVERENQMMGLPVESPGERVAGLAELVDLLKPLLAGETVTAADAHYRLREAKAGISPVQQPRPPLLIAGSGRKMLSLAGKEADKIALAIHPAAPAAEIHERIGWIMQAAGDRFDEIELAVSLSGMLLPDRPPQPPRWGPDPVELAAAGALFVLHGTPAEMSRQLRERRDTFGVSYIVVPEDDMEAFAPVVAELAGK